MYSRQRMLVRKLATALALMAALSACGQKGDLYLPEPEQEKSEHAEAE